MKEHILLREVLSTLTKQSSFFVFYQRERDCLWRGAWSLERVTTTTSRMMRKRGGGNPNNNNGKSSFGNSSSAVSKLLSQNQTLNNTVNGSNGSYKDGQTILLEVREPIFAGPYSHNTTPMNGHRGSSTSAAGGDDDHHNHNSKSTMAQLNAKNHKLAKELVRSDRLKHSSLSRLVRLKKLELIFVSDYSFFKFIHSQPLL